VSTPDPFDYRISATVHTTRREVLYALRALSMAAQRTGNNKLPWSGVTDHSWRNHNHHATFRFTTADYRRQFREWAEELLLADSWQYVGDSDNDPPPIDA
jgi:hypothetical protein